MTGVSLDVRITDEEVSRAFTRLISIMGDTTPVMGAIGTGLVGSTRRRFVSQTAPDGSPWKGLDPDYKATKRNSRILTESGRLRDSINRRAGRDHVLVGTNVIYAAPHQFGATITPKTSSHLVFFIGSSKVATKSVTIPERPFLGISGDDQDMISETVFRALQRRL